MLQRKIPDILFVKVKKSIFFPWEKYWITFANISQQAYIAWSFTSWTHLLDVFDMEDNILSSRDSVMIKTGDVTNHSVLIF